VTKPEDPQQSVDSGPGSGPSARAIDDLIALYDAGRYPEVEAAARTMTESWPHHAFSWKILGTALAAQQRLSEALPVIRKSAALSPADPAAFNNLGFVQQALSQVSEAESSFRRALDLNPEFAEAHCNLGNALRELGRANEALASYQRAIAIKPDLAMAHSNLGAVLWDLDRFDEALGSYSRATSISPDLAETHANLGAAFSEFGKPEEAAASYLRAAKVSPGNQKLPYELLAALVLPIISPSRSHIARWRARYADEISRIARSRAGTRGPRPGVPLLAKAPAFFLAYHDENDRALMESLHRLIRDVYPEVTFSAPHLSRWRHASAGSRKLRIGFASEFLVEHTIGKLFQGFIRELDRTRFEVIVFHAPKARMDQARERIDRWSDRSISLAGSLAMMQQAVANEQLDVLFYPDIGMSTATYFLAFARLAPVQATSFGHPDTTGIDTIDYFVSADSWEPPGAEALYSESLIRLGRLPSFYQPLVPARLADRAELGLPEGVTLYGCPQSLFKFHPDFDAVLDAIAEGDPEGRIVLIESKRDAPLAGLLRARWARSAPMLLKRALFLPSLTHSQFMALNAHTDVLLDPVHFGGGNTMYEAMVYGTPIVAWPGRFMRGRLTAGAYHQMEIADAPIARHLEDYAALALALGRDPIRRQALRQSSVTAAQRKLFEDHSAVREFEAFLLASVDAASRGTKLPSGWTPGMPAH
jgi:predicted O-linked N-acetylglucosamine transferase (SPINDLY family)